MKRLDLFGSATGSAFAASRSDVDFLIEFAELSSGEYASHYHTLLKERERQRAAHPVVIDLPQSKAGARERAPATSPLPSDRRSRTRCGPSGTCKYMITRDHPQVHF